MLTLELKAARSLSLASLLAAALFSGAPAFGQAPDKSSQPSTAKSAQSQLPFPSQLKKTVVFIEADCEPSAAELDTLSADEHRKWLLHLESQMQPDILAKIQHAHSGTGFLVAVEDERLAQTARFLYLVTNRHVAQPGIEDGTPCSVRDYKLSMNVHLSASGEEDVLNVRSLGPQPGWIFPEDPAVDLAVLPLALEPTTDYMTIGSDQFLDDEMIRLSKVSEGDPVIFAGLFLQHIGKRRLEPIIRSGTLAMMPIELVDTTLKRPGHVYFAEAHSFFGNSGSPILVDIRRFEPDTSGYEYRLLGVVAGFVPESSDLTLHVTTDYSAKLAANSGVCVVVPAFEIRKILFSAELKQKRDRDVEVFLSKRPPAGGPGPNPLSGPR